MKRCLFLASFLLIASITIAQLQKISLPAGTPEDKALQAASNEPDAQKKLAMYQDVVQQFESWRCGVRELADFAALPECCRPR